MTPRPTSTLRAAITPLAVPAAAPPLGVATGKDVHLSGDLEKGAGDLGIAGVVLALVGIDVPCLAPAETHKGLVGVAVATLDGKVPDVDLLRHDDLLASIIP